MGLPRSLVDALRRRLEFGLPRFSKLDVPQDGR
jgi:hypothetical protein